MARMSVDRGCGWTSRRFVRFLGRISTIQRNSVRLGTRQSKGRSTPARSAHSDEIQSVVYEVEHALGKVVIRNMDETDIDGAAVLLSRSFAGREWQSLEEVRSYLRQAYILFPESILLVAELFRESTHDRDASLERPGMLLALADLALSTLLVNTILPKKYATIPEDSAYLSNMCVDPKFRGCGVGKCMLHACDRVVMDLGQRNRISLHANSDIAPFYVNNGYEGSSNGAVWQFIKPGPVVMTKLLPQSQ